MKEPKHVKTMFHRCSPSFSDWGWGDYLRFQMPLRDFQV